MKKLLLIFLLLLLPTNSHAEINKIVLSQIAHSSVALTTNQQYPYCGAVWINDNTLLTAKHCLQTIKKYENNNNPTLHFISFHNPTTYHATILASHPIYDLALLYTTIYPNHQNITLNLNPQINQQLHIIGHPNGSLWKYLKGNITNFPSKIDNHPFGPFIQVNANVTKGFSGNGAFDQSGNLIGLSSFIYTDVSNTAFYVSAQHIQEFIHEYQ